MKRVLVVSYCYLPSETSAALQTVSLVRMLPKEGWRPVVLTVAPEWQYLPTNTDTPGSGVEVVHTRHWRPLAALERAVRPGSEPQPGASAQDASVTTLTLPISKSDDRTPEQLIRAKNTGAAAKLTRRDIVHTSSARRAGSISILSYQWLSAALRSALRAVYRNLRPTDEDFLFPLFAACKGYRVARGCRPSAIYSIGKPFSSLVAGQILANILRLPHVVEFHDPWTLSPSYGGTGLIASFEKKLERWLIAGASAVIAKTDAELDLVRKSHPGARANFCTVPCGFDETRMPEPAAVAPPKSMLDGVVRIVHSGALSERRSPLGFLLALKQLLGDNPTLQYGLKVFFAGRFDTFEGRSLSDWCGRLGLGENVEIKGWLRREELLDLMAEADIFVVLPDNWHQIPAKIYEYLWFGRRILVLCEEGSESAKLVQKHKRGLFALRSDADSITKALRSLVEQCQAEPPPRAGDQSLAPYSARGRAEAVAQILNSICF